MSAQPQAELPDGASTDGTQPRAFGPLGDERRRAMWSFLTWAFVLAEAFRGAEAYAAAPMGAEDAQLATPPPSSDATKPAALADDEPMLRDWPIEATPDGTMEGPARAVFAPPIPAGGTEDPLPADTLEPSPVKGGGGASAGGSGHGAPSNAGDLSQTGEDLEAKLSLLGVDAGVATSAGLSIELQPISLSLLEGASNTLSELIGPVLDVAPTLDALSSSVQGLLGGAVALDGQLTFAALTSDGPSDALFAGGRYSDYHLALRADGPISLGAGSGIGDPADLIQIGDDVVLPDATHQSANNQHLALPSAIDDLLLRTSIDHVL